MLGRHCAAQGHGNLMPAARSTTLQIASLLLIFMLGGAAAAATYLAVPSPIQCKSNSSSSGCTVENYTGLWVDRKPCKAAKAVFPTTEAELFEAVASASKAGSKIKVVSKGSHSIPKLVCPGGEEGVLISTKYYNSLIRVNRSSMTVTAQSGVMLGTLFHEIALHGLTLSHAPAWEGVSLGGMISTGAHGSGMWGVGSAPHDYVVGMRLIVPASEEEGYAKTVDVVEGDEDLNAARLSLGVLGAISTVTFQLEPMFKRSVALQIRGDEQLEDEILEFAALNEFGKINWYPASGKALFKLDNRVSGDVQGDGSLLNPALVAIGVHVIESWRTSLEAFQEGPNIDELCQEEAKAWNSRYTSGDGLRNSENSFTGYPVVGFHHKMEVSRGCDTEEASPRITPIGIDMESTHEHFTHGDSQIEQCKLSIHENNNLVTCFWNSIIKSHHGFDTAISIPSSKVRDAINEIKKLRDINPKSMCDLKHGGGLWIRFMASSRAYLGEPTSSFVFEMGYYRSKYPNVPRFHQDIYEEIEQILVKKFEGKPHWGKNRDFVFDDMNSRTLAMEKFLEVRQKYDPRGLFSSEWSNAILGIHSSSHRDVQIYEDHCALEGLCVCKVDIHCHPTKGYFCRPGHVYKEARVCRYEK